MKKRLLLFMLGVSLMFASGFSSQAAYEYDAPEAMDGQTMVKVNLGTMVGYTSESLNGMSEAEIENHFWVAYEDADYQEDIDADLWNWFLNSQKYTSQQKYDICNSTCATSNILFYWLLLNDEISLENKVQYFRTHDIRYTDDNIKNWWWINIGSKLTVETVNPTDSHNFEWYTRAFYSSSMENNLEFVYIGSRDGGSCYMDSRDLEECIKQGTIVAENFSYSIGNSPSVWDKRYYSLVGYNTGYMMWKLQ